MPRTRPMEGRRWGILRAWTSPRRAESLLPGPLTQVVHVVHHPQIEVGGGPAGEALQDPRLLNHLHHRPVERVMPVPNGLGLRHLVAGLHTPEVAVNGDMLGGAVVCAG